MPSAYCGFYLFHYIGNPIASWCKKNFPNWFEPILNNQDGFDEARLPFQQRRLTEAEEEIEIQQIAQLIPDIAYPTPPESDRNINLDDYKPRGSPDQFSAMITVHRIDHTIINTAKGAIVVPSKIVYRSGDEINIGYHRDQIKVSTEWPEAKQNMEK